MKQLIITVLALVIFTLSANAQSTYNYSDAYGNKYKSYENLWKDRDGDGVENYYDRHDQNPNVGTSKTPSYAYPSYYNNYSSSYSSGSKTIYVGPRGGKYYINSNGNKTYIRD